MRGYGVRPGSELRFIQPGKRDRNACTERCDRTDREETLSVCLYDALNAVRDVAIDWLARPNSQAAETSTSNGQSLMPPISDTALRLRSRNRNAAALLRRPLRQ